MIQERTTNFRDILKRELETRCQRNPRYSLRSFARDLGISAPRLSHVLKGTYGLSRVAAEKLGRRLGWGPAEIESFVDLVESEHARSQAAREIAKGRLEQRQALFSDLGIDAFRAISDWYHFALMELTRVKGFQSAAGWIARALGISSHEASGAVERLRRLELLEDRDGKLAATGNYFANAAGVPSEAVRNFHRQVLAKASDALTFQDVSERDFSALVLAIDEADLPRAKEFIKRFRDQFDSEFSKSPRPTRVYGLGIQLFALQEKNVPHPPSNGNEKESSHANL